MGINDQLFDELIFDAHIENVLKEFDVVKANFGYGESSFGTQETGNTT